LGMKELPISASLLVGGKNIASGKGLAIYCVGDLPGNPPLHVLVYTHHDS